VGAVDQRTEEKTGLQAAPWTARLSRAQPWATQAPGHPGRGRPANREEVFRSAESWLRRRLW